MSEIIRGKHGDTVQSDTFGITVHTGPTEPPEDPSRWRVKKITDADVQKRFLWTASQLEIARAHLGFPRGESVITTTWLSKTTRQTLEREIASWSEHARACGLLE